MLEEYKPKATIGILGGWSLCILGGSLLDNDDKTAFMLLALGLLISMWGFAMVAIGKGRSKLWSLLAIFGFLGFLLLLILKDHHKNF